jgi:serine/threonine protein kinase
MPAAAAVSAVLDIIGGLDAAQAAGILHRDIKPSNCFVDADGAVKVGDFGLSISTLTRDVQQELATTGFEGTPQFAAPEQLRGEPDGVRERKIILKLRSRTPSLLQDCASRHLWF